MKRSACAKLIMSVSAVDMAALADRLTRTEQRLDVIDEKETGLMDALCKKFAELEVAADQKHADNMRALREVVNAAQEKFLEIEERLKGGGVGGGLNKNKGFLPDKMMVPSRFSDDVAQWRKWKETVAKYFDEGREGIKAIMDEVAKATSPVDLVVLQQVAEG